MTPTPKIRFSDAAQDSYAAALDYLLEHNQFAAERFVTDVDMALERVRRFPESGPVIPEDPRGRSVSSW